MADDTLAFDSLSNEDLLKEAPANFFLTASQAENLELLAGYVREDRGRPIFVTGPAGFGKTTLVRQFMARNLQPRTEVEWISLREHPEPLRHIEAALLRLRTTRTENRLLIVLDDAEMFSEAQLERTLNRNAVRCEHPYQRAIPHKAGKHPERNQQTEQEDSLAMCSTDGQFQLEV